jgi:DNA ligase (NAD+)
MPTTTTEQLITIIKNFKHSGIPILDTLSQDVLSQIIILSNNLYYNSTEQQLLTDNEYDIIKEYVTAKFPANQIVNTIGAPAPSGKNKVILPYQMWSMDKIKPDTNALANWMAKYSGPYILSCKLDGVSGLYTTTGPTPKLYTRGDGIVGQDVSHLLTVLKLPTLKGHVVRGEFIIPKNVFETKYANTFANPRNLTAGIVNSKTTDEKTHDIHFVTYECIVPELKPSKQLELLTKTGFEVVNYQVCATVTNEQLSANLVDRRKTYAYEIDGIIVCDDNIYQRTSGNPDSAFAFKMVLSDQKAEAKVVDVLWEPSKDGYLKPRVRIEPVVLGGVTITYATGYNAKFIQENKIGVGAVIELIRSGDVIPKILSVSVPADVTKMPSVTYTWNETHVDVLLENASENSTVREKNIVAFFTEIEVDGLKAGNVRKIMEAGYDTIPKILAMTKPDFEKVGFKTTAIKYETNIKEKVAKASLVQIIVASGTLGRGIGAKKIESVLATFPNIFVSEESNSSKIAKLKMVEGIEQKTAQQIVDNIPNLIQFLKETGLEYKLISTSVINLCDDYPCSPTMNEETGETEKCTVCDGWFADDGAGDILYLPMNTLGSNNWNYCSLCKKGNPTNVPFRKLCVMKMCNQVLCVSGCDESVEDDEDDEDDEEEQVVHPLFGKSIVMTKVRDKAIIESLAKYGAKLVDTITKNTFVLIVKSKTDVSNKTKYAEQHNIPIMTPDEFVAKYMVGL